MLKASQFEEMLDFVKEELNIDDETLKVTDFNKIDSWVNNINQSVSRIGLCELLPPKNSLDIQYEEMVMMLSCLSELKINAERLLEKIKDAEKDIVNSKYFTFNKGHAKIFADKAEMNRKFLKDFIRNKQDGKISKDINTSALTEKELADLFEKESNNCSDF